MESAEKLKKLIEAASKILVTSHISPDPDALTSLLLLGTTLQANYPQKEVMMTSEELTGDLHFLYSYGQIQQQPLLTAVSDFEPDLLIIVDAMNWERCSRNEAAAVRQKIKSLKAKVAIIDHHEEVDIESGVDIYINQGSPATVQDVFEICFNHWRLQKPEGYAETTLLGILSDSARFMYDNPRYRETFEVVSHLLEAGASIEKIENKLARYNADQMSVFSELARNVVSAEGYNYSYISDAFASGWLESTKSLDDLKLGCEIFVSQYIRNIGSNNWGFIIYPELIAGVGKYSVSFRSLGGIKDVSKIARALGGGGHKPAAGAKFAASSVKDALELVKSAIKDSL